MRLGDNKDDIVWILPFQSNLFPTSWFCETMIQIAGLEFTGNDTRLQAVLVEKRWTTTLLLFSLDWMMNLRHGFSWITVSVGGGEQFTLLIAEAATKRRRLRSRSFSFWGVDQKWNSKLRCAKDLFFERVRPHTSWFFILQDSHMEVTDTSSAEE